MHIFEFEQANESGNGDRLDFRYLARTMQMREAVEGNLGVPATEVAGTWARFRRCMRKK